MRVFVVSRFLAGVLPLSNFASFAATALANSSSSTSTSSTSPAAVSSSVSDFLTDLNMSLFRGTFPSGQRAETTSTRIITYNVLSSHLADPAYFPVLNPAHLKASYRLPLILKKLEEAIGKTDDEPHSSSPSASFRNLFKNNGNNKIVCLQEVSYEWAGEFHKFFANRGYHFVTGLYGKKSSGYMGVALAYPMDSYETVDIDISRLSDKRSGGWPREPEPEEKNDQNNRKEIKSRSLTVAAPALLTKNVLGFLLKQLHTIQILKKRATSFVPFLKGKEEQEKERDDHWEMSERRYNVLITATLRDKKTGQVFCVATYHMPCAFYAPMSMTIHAEMAATRVQKIAARQLANLLTAEQEGSAFTKGDGSSNSLGSGNGNGHGNGNGNGNGNGASMFPPSMTLPYVLAGDFNIISRDEESPTYPVYQMLTTASLDRTSPCFPTSHKWGMEWNCTMFEHLESAYVKKNGEEPDFTNYAHMKDNEHPFIDTLDYIFLSPDQWTVKDVKKLRHRDKAGGPYPNADEPSDHVMIWADLELA